MKKSKYKIPCLILAFLLFFFNQPLISYAASTSDSNQDISGKKTYRKVSIYQAKEAEFNFYKGDYDGAALIFEALRQKKDRNYALWNNQLGSIYLAKGEYEKALDAFLKAYYLMNDISAFRGLEARAVSLFGSEAKKAYKGDPYEKVFNSLYTALLLYREGDLENTLAALKNGILADSDVQADLYQSDTFILYLLASRITSLQGNKTLSKEYFNKTVDAYYLVFPTNRMIVSEEQAQRFLLLEKEKELDEIKGPKKSTKKTPTKIEELEAEIEIIDNNIKTLQERRNNNNASIEVSMLEDFVNLKNNTLLYIELGRGPLKYPIGKYGQLAVFTAKPYEIEKIKIFIDGIELGSDKPLLNNDVLFQAITRGGRQMDGILKGQAQFKQTTADVSMALARASQNIMDQARYQQAVNPYYDPTGANIAAGVMSLISLGVAIASAVANPAADVKHWSLMPGDINIVPFYLAPGTHNIKFECYDDNNKLLSKLSSEITVNIQEKRDNIIFKRFF